MLSTAERGAGKRCPTSSRICSQAPRRLHLTKHSLWNGKVATSALTKLKHTWTTGLYMDLFKAEVIDAQPFMTTWSLLESLHTHTTQTLWIEKGDSICPCQRVSGYSGLAFDNLHTLCLPTMIVYNCIILSILYSFSTIIIFLFVNSIHTYYWHFTNTVLIQQHFRYHLVVSCHFLSKSSLF